MSVAEYQTVHRVELHEVRQKMARVLEIEKFPELTPGKLEGVCVLISQGIVLLNSWSIQYRSQKANTIFIELK